MQKDPYRSKKDGSPAQFRLAVGGNAFSISASGIAIMSIAVTAIGIVLFFLPNIFSTTKSSQWEITAKEALSNVDRLEYELSTMQNRKEKLETENRLLRAEIDNLKRSNTKKNNSYTDK